MAVITVNNSVDYGWVIAERSLFGEFAFLHVNDPGRRHVAALSLSRDETIKLRDDLSAIIGE